MLALSWILISPTPGPHVKEMKDAAMFYTNRVLKEYKGNILYSSFPIIVAIWPPNPNKY